MEQQQRTELGRAVKAARLQRGLGKEPAARDIEVSSITLKRVEDGLSVREDSLAKILRYFDLPMPGVDAELVIEPAVVDDAARLRRLVEQADVSPELRQRVLDAIEQRPASQGQAGEVRGA